MSGDKLPALSLPTASQPPLSGQSYRTTYEDASAPGSNNASTRTSLSGPAPLSTDLRTPPPSADLGAQSAPQEYSLASQPVSESYYPNPTPLGGMNSTQPYMDVHSSHLSSAQPYASQAAPAGAMTHYTGYHQPPVLQPASTYGPASSYSQYAYPNSVTSSQPPSSMGSHVPTQLLPLPGKLALQPVGIPSNHLQSLAMACRRRDTATTPERRCRATSMTRPVRWLPRERSPVSRPLSGRMKGVFVIRWKPRACALPGEKVRRIYPDEVIGKLTSADNSMINGTKLLNVAGMTRGRRDGILKSEKIRHVVKIGPMHLKGVWYVS